MLDQLRNASSLRADGRNTAGHRFQRHQTKAFFLGRQQQQISQGNHLGDLILLAEETNLVLKPHFTDLGLDFGQLRPFPYQQQP
ncbi:hypothetical protein D3C75_1000930 [compost metagenome]